MSDRSRYAKAITLLIIVCILIYPVSAAGTINPSTESGSYWCRFYYTKWICDLTPSGSSGPAGPAGPPGSGYITNLWNLTGNFTGNGTINYFTTMYSEMNQTPNQTPGPQGEQGIPGLNNMTPGPQGEQGEQGIQGIPGLANMTAGPQGPRGEDGTNGTNGEDGEQGIPGINGTQGIQGEQGIQGIPGAANMTAGPRGERGEDGTNGEDGQDGEKGDKGDKGDPGINGTIPDSSKFLFLNGTRAMTGNLNMGSNQITSLITGSTGDTAVNKTYVDGKTAGMLQTLRKTSDQTINAGAGTFVDISDLTFPVTNGSSYAFYYYIAFTSLNATFGWKAGVNAPTGDLDFWAQSDVIANGVAGVATHTERHNDARDDMTLLTSTVTANVPLAIRIDGRYLCTQDGTFAPRFANELASNSNIKVLKGSYGWYF